MNFKVYLSKETGELCVGREVYFKESADLVKGIVLFMMERFECIGIIIDRPGDVFDCRVITLEAAKRKLECLGNL